MSLPCFAHVKRIGVSACLLMLLLTSSSRSELLLNYDFNDASNPSLATDRSGKNNHAELFDATYTPDGGGRTGQAGDRAMDFGGDQDNVYIEVTTAADGAFQSIVDKDSATIALWAFGGEFQPQNNFVFWFAEGDSDPRQLSAHIPWSNGFIYFDASGCCGGDTRISAPLDESIYRDTWSHYAFVKDGESTAIYVNGELFLDSGGNFINPLTDIFTVRFGSGQAPGQWSYNGLMDDICVWDEAISEETIAGLAQGASCSDGGPGFPRGDFNRSGQLDAGDIDLLSAEVRAGTNQSQFDLNNDQKVDDTDRRLWVTDANFKKTWFGDANLNGEFNSGDFVQVFQAGKFETGQAAGWGEGDWSGDNRFDSGDFVLAFQDGGFERGPRAAAAAVPEPSATVLLGIGAFLAFVRLRLPRRAK